MLSEQKTFRVSSNQETVLILVVMEYALGGESQLMTYGLLALS